MFGCLEDPGLLAWPFVLASMLLASSMVSLKAVFASMIGRLDF
jgi:hypothetical protein